MSSYAKYDSLGEENQPNPEINHSENNHGFNPVVTITNADQKKQIIETNDIVIFDLYTEWCQPCKVIAPKFEKLARKLFPLYGKHLVFCKEDAEKQFTKNIRGVPCFHIYHKGNFYHSCVGSQHIDTLESKIRELLNQL